MTKGRNAARLTTGVRNFDVLLDGGIPSGSIFVLAGSPGAGKTILAQQICFHHATTKRRVLYFSTLSEPTAKTLRYLSAFDFFDATKLETAVQFVDLGIILRSKGLEEASSLLMQHVRKVKPTLVVVDSFKVFDDLARDSEDLRKFSYELAVHLMAWETTALLLGEYGPDDIATNPLFSIADGLATLTQHEQSGEEQRFLKIIKLRGAAHSRDEYPFAIGERGIEVYAPRVTIVRDSGEATADRCKTHISKLDELLGEGIPRGSSFLVGGVAGTGKTVLLLEFIYRGALAGEKGILFSFEETRERLRASARGLGWELDHEIERGMIEIVFVPQPDILVESHLLMMRERVQSMGAKRVAVDSVSVFLHKINDAKVAREKLFQLGSIIQNSHAIGFFATDIPYGTNKISRFGVEETVVDGVILLTSTEEGFDRERYLEVYKLRNTAHLKGRHSMAIGAGGVSIFPRYNAEPEAAPRAINTSRRLASGIAGLDPLIGGGLLERSATLVSGGPGIGKTTFALQFILEGAKRGERGLFISLEEGPEQLLTTARELGLTELPRAIKRGIVDIFYSAGERIRGNQFLALLTDKIRADKRRRIVLDSVTQMEAGALKREDSRALLVALVARFRLLGTTSLLTLESEAILTTDSNAERGFSPIADNLFLLRYERAAGTIGPTLTVLKTRSSEHDWRAHPFVIGQGGLRVDSAISPKIPGRPRKGVHSKKL